MNGDALMLVTVGIIGVVIAAPYLIGVYREWKERRRPIEPFWGEMIGGKDVPK